MEKIYEILMKLPRKNLIGLLMQSLDEMQSYNGRTREYCICSAMGMKEEYDKDGNIIFKMIPFSEIKENTDSFI